MREPCDFALAQSRTFRNLVIMRFVCFVFALACSFSLAHAAENADVKTNSVFIGMPGTLEFVTPSGWTYARTNLNLPGKPQTLEMHSPDNTIAIRLYLVWEGFGGKAVRPTDAEMRASVRQNVTKQYLPKSVEKSFELENLSGPNVKGVFARFTDAHWTPMEKNTYHNVATGMFLCENLWGGFELFCNDKDGPQSKTGLQVLQSLRRIP
jgi:hypothetical protein